MFLMIPMIPPYQSQYTLYMVLAGNVPPFPSVANMLRKRLTSLVSSAMVSWILVRSSRVYDLLPFAPDMVALAVPFLAISILTWRSVSISASAA